MQPQKLTSRKSWGYENKRNNEERSINGSAVVKGILPLRRGNFLRAYTQGYIYIYSIISKQPRQGNGTKALREFIDLFGEYSDLWLFCDDELGTNIRVQRDTQKASDAAHWDISDFTNGENIFD